jgi:hypothetical protein
VSELDVIQYGLDVYGRPVWMTVLMRDWFEGYCDELGWVPRILQGCFMERLGGGAAASQGAHDKAKCLDLETDGRTVVEIDRMVRVARTRGAGAYRRDQSYRHGSMQPHMHLTLGVDEPGSPMAETLWASYVAGGDGLGIQPPQPDYEWRPDPLVLTPPEDDMKEEDFDRIQAMLDAQRASIVKDLLKAAVNKAGDTVKKALRLGAGLAD